MHHLLFHLITQEMVQMAERRRAGLSVVAAHKLGGPKGIGAVALREGREVPGLVLGGGQERGLRAGTESVFLVEGFSAATEWVWARFAENATRLGRCHA